MVPVFVVEDSSVTLIVGEPEAEATNIPARMLLLLAITVVEVMFL